MKQIVIRFSAWPPRRTVRQSFLYVQLLRRYNEAISLEYVVPFRVVGNR